MTTRRRNFDDVFADSEDDDDAEFRSSTWNFIENSGSQRRSESFRGGTQNSDFGNFERFGGRGSSNGIETRTSFRELPTTPVSATRTASTYQFHYVTRRVSSTGQRHTTVELEHTARPLQGEPEPERVYKREIPVQMVGNGSSAGSYSRYSMAQDTIQRYSSQNSSSGISPHQRLSSYSLHSIVEFWLGLQ
ncbi:hypothetical protein L3Y34_016466 [Caenorhabditis briggsae]|uniref:Uncharacterized protein n=1 Tax=Caenorhabditis briggsae TaxID=6238 RepID=A0AAE9DXH9_CAEBR|nr:hypothetical protein L3Y34_016466 [Caenorhabditis briggsae]